MRERQAKSDRRTVVENIDRITFEPDRLREPVDRRGQIVEGVFEGRRIRRVGKPEARKIGSDQVIAIGEQRKQIAKHMRRSREAVQKQEGRRIRVACFTIEDLAAIDDGRAISDGHG